MIEVCFCGHTAPLTDRIPVVGDGGSGTYGLQCPACGHVDTMRWFSEAYRLELWTEAAARVASLGVAPARHEIAIGESV